MLKPFARWISLTTKFAICTAATVALSGCLALYLPNTYHVTDTTVLSSPFPNLLIEYAGNDAEAPLSVSVYTRALKKPLPPVRFVRASIVDDNGKETNLRLKRAILENPSSYLMEFYPGSLHYTGHLLQLRLTLLVNGKETAVTANFYIKTKVHWPSDSDYSG
jgi:hypothetical protein